MEKYLEIAKNFNVELSEDIMSNITLFFQYMNKRELVRIRKEKGEPKPWTDDIIIQSYKFCNVNREDDKVTRWMRQNWTIPNEKDEISIQLFNCCLFRYFNNVGFCEVIGYQHDWNSDRIVDIAERMMYEGKKVFTGAYIITNGGVADTKPKVVCKVYLDPIWEHKEELAKIATETHSWKSVVDELSQYQGFGGTKFMSMQAVLDMIHTPVLRNCTDRNDYCPVGPGARRGLSRIFCRVLGQGKFDLNLREMKFLLEISKDFVDDFMFKLHLDDIEFTLCEFDKYVRVYQGEGKPRSIYNGQF